MPYQFDPEKLKAFLKDKELSRYAFSQLSGISEARLSQLFNGKTKPASDFFCTILNHFPNTSLNDFFTDKQ